MKSLVSTTVIAILLAVGLGLLATQHGRSGEGNGATPSAPQAAPAASQPAARPAAPAQASAAPAVEIVKRPEEVPPAIGSRAPATVRVDLETKEVVGVLADGTTYPYWTFNGTVPGPFIRVRVGDTVELHLKNAANSAWPHSIDLHAVTGPGGGATVTQTPAGQETMLRFKALNPGLFVYHCATAPVHMHVAMGMYGLILVEPEEGLPPVDREFYLMQAELYTSGPRGAKGNLQYSPAKATEEHPDYVVFNGKPGGLTETASLKAKVGERIRIYVGVGGFLSSSFHVIGEIFDLVYPEAALLDPIRHVQTTTIPAGGAAVVEFTAEVPGRYIVVDHALPRVFDKGAVAHLDIEGPEAPDIYSGTGTGAAGH